jgi:hypothetical protein
MTKEKFLWGTLAMVFGVILAGCDTGDTGDIGNTGGSGGGDGVPSNSGKLTITEISAYNGKFAIATGLKSTISGTESGHILDSEPEFLLFCAKATGATSAEAVPISNGQVALPVYKAGETKFESYSGNDTVTLMIVILSSEVLGGESMENAVASLSGISVTFVNGIGTVTIPTIESMDG